MNLKISSLRGTLVAAIATLLFTVLPAAAQTAENELGESAWTLSVPSGLSASDVQNAIITALAGRQWNLKSKSDGQVVGYLKHRSNEATVTFVYDTTKIECFCVGWEINKKTGVRKGPEQPRNWLKNLQGDTTKNLTLATVGK